MKLSDYVADFLYKQNLRHIFLYSGGAIVHVADSIDRHPKLKIIIPQHEQGGAAAADGYSRITENLGCMITTSGPGGTNTVTSVCNSYFDSIPVLIITGQVATFRIKPSKALRQKGFQETDMVSIFRSITKYAVQIKKAEDIRYELEKAVYLAKSGRPGPVLLDLPDDLQRAEIDPANLRPFSPPKRKKVRLKKQFKKILELIEKSKRPILILGAGIRVTSLQDEAKKFVEYFKMPVLLTWGGMDLFPYDYPYNMGGVGVCGPRGGNFAVQNADLVIALGTRLSQMITGGKQNLFAPHAKKVMVDIDREELEKFGPNDFKLDIKILADLSDFFAEARKYYKKPFPVSSVSLVKGALSQSSFSGFRSRRDRFAKWRETIKEWRKRYPICPKEYYQEKGHVNAYVFIKELSRILRPEDIILTDAGGNLSWTMQNFEIKKGQRLISAWNHSPMGYSVPASIGAALAGRRKVYCITGDGGLMMCLEELGTIRRHNLPIKIYIFNNHGHGIQKQTMDTWLAGRYTAVDEKTGLWFPDFEKVAETFKIRYFHIRNHGEIGKILKKTIAAKGPVLCDVEINPDQKIVPMLKFGSSLEDLDPKLPTEELEKIMICHTKAKGEIKKEIISSEAKLI